MTRLEEIVQEAKHHEREEGFTQLVKDTKGLYSAYGIGFLEGAEWADKTIIDRAIKFFQSKSKHGMIEENINEFIDEFCKVVVKGE